MKKQNLSQFHAKLKVDNIRKLYKWSHSVSQGGWHFCQNVLNCELRGELKSKLRENLENLLRPQKIPDLTIKIFPTHFHVFLPLKPTINPMHFINQIRSSVTELGIELDEKHLWETIYDVSQEHIDTILKELLGGKYEYYSKGD